MYKNPVNRYYKSMLKELMKSDMQIREGHTCCDVYWLTEPGILGYRFNPISMWYFVKEEKIVTIIANVSNTPWGEEVLYEVPVNNSTKVWKQLHVSPFNPPRNQYYLFNTNINKGGIFDPATIRLDISLFDKDDSLVLSANMKLVAVKTPKYIFFNFIIIIFRIYYQALLLWLGKFPLYYHIAKDSKNELSE